MSAPGLTMYRVGVTEWASYSAYIQARNPDHARKLARSLWSNNNEHGAFQVRDGGIDDDIVVDTVDGDGGAS